MRLLSGPPVAIVPGTTVVVRSNVPLVFDKIVVPAPEPRRVIPLLTSTKLLTTNVPGPSRTICPAGQASTAACIAAELSPALGDSVAPHCERFVGMPPTEVIPGFQGNPLSAGKGNCAKAGRLVIKTSKVTVNFHM